MEWRAIMIKLHTISKRYSSFMALRGISLTIQRGEIYGIIGASGAGKSTLLRVMNLLELPSEGEVEVDGQLLTQLKGKQIREARKSIGMIFQQFNLVLNKTVFDNVALALQIAHYPKQEQRARVLQCLQFVGLESFADKYPATLSGGQKQRVAIARALANEPKVLLCDEPTSALDPSTTAEILTVLEMINKKLGVTIVIVSHEMDVIKSICNRVTVLEDGAVYETVSIEPKGITQKGQSAQRFVDELVGGDST